MEGQDDQSGAREPWQFQTPRRGRWSDALGLIIVLLFVSLESSMLVILVRHQLRRGLYWAALGTALVTAALLYVLIVFARQHWIHSIRFDGERLWLGRSRSFEPDDVSFLKAHERPGAFGLCMINIGSGRRRCPRICLGLPEFLAACERLDELCRRAVKVYVFHSRVSGFNVRGLEVAATREGTDIAIPEGLERPSPGYRHLRRFLLGKAWGSLIGGMAFLAMAILGATLASHPFVIAFTVLLVLVACASFWAMWQQLKSWKQVKASLPPAVDSAFRRDS